jgi:hypothetical protein
MKKKNIAWREERNEEGVRKYTIIIPGNEKREMLLKISFED